MKLLTGKANIILDGQFGSTGKGLLAAYVSENNHIDIACTRLSPNAGHTFYYNNTKYITKQMPVAGIIHPRSTIYIGFGSVIDIDLFKQELKDFDIDPSRVIIHPRTAIITKDERDLESSSGIISIASTLSGTGIARSSKIMRTNKLAQGCKELQPFLTKLDLSDLLDHDCNALIETGQGFDLSLNMGLSYPYCTSTDITPSAILADFGLHPRYLGNVFMSIRTYPIRVGNPTDSDGNEIGFSGPVYPGSLEINYADLGVDVEYTTVTKRKRRIFTFSEEQYLRSLKHIEPDYIFLNFINYLREEDLELFKNIPQPTHVGYGPYTFQIRPYEQDICENYYYKK